MKRILCFCLLEIMTQYTDKISPHLTRAAIFGRVHMEYSCSAAPKITEMANLCQNVASYLLKAALRFGSEKL